MSLLKILFVLLTPLLLFGAKPDFLVNAEWLEEHIEDPKTVILEVRYYPHRYYTVGHIEGAMQVQRFKDLGANNEIPTMRFPKKEAFEKTLRSWGVDNDSMVVLYDDSRSALASRVYFLLDLFGFDMSRVKILDGGNMEWQVFNEMVKEKSTPKQGNVTLKKANNALLAEWTEIYEKVVAERDSESVLIDSRPHTHYTGEEIKHSIQGGHIPGAINVVSLDGTQSGGSSKWQSMKDIAKLYEKVPKNKTIYLYCHDGFRMTLGYMQLKALGYKNVKLYNGGWGDWGMNLSLPVVQGTKPYDSAFEL
ncbi:MAG: rhodanese-like domain-containing protein [Sulfurimonas sp.]|jgi:thiosulfate/3-mercaptopyruvate sulfurtransferase|nr:rhodanese-like domain-containing protein [Sulfurimonas sp.]